MKLNGADWVCSTVFILVSVSCGYCLRESLHTGLWVSTILCRPSAEVYEFSLMSNVSGNYHGDTWTERVFAWTERAVSALYRFDCIL